MRISDLSRHTGVPVATIKFYLRERLLPPGRSTSRNQAVYGEQHLRRLWLIRAFTSIGRLDLSSVRELLNAIEDRQLPLPNLFEAVNRVLFSEEPALSATKKAQADIDEFIDVQGWQVADDSRGRIQLALVVTALQRLGCATDIDFFTPYAEAANELARQELRLLDTGSASGRAEAVVRTVLLEVAFTAMLRMSQEHQVAAHCHECAPDPEPS